MKPSHHHSCASVMHSNYPSAKRSTHLHACHGLQSTLQLRSRDESCLKDFIVCHDIRLVEKHQNTHLVRAHVQLMFLPPKNSSQICRSTNLYFTNMSAVKLTSILACDGAREHKNLARDDLNESCTDAPSTFLARRVHNKVTM